MKAKIAKQEGELRHTKKLNDQLERQIRMLELALKNERTKSRSQDAGKTKIEGQQESPQTNSAEVSLVAATGNSRGLLSQYTMSPAGNLTDPSVRSRHVTQFVPRYTRAAGGIHRGEGAIPGQVEEVSRKMHARDSVLIIASPTSSTTANEYAEWSGHRTSRSSADAGRCIRSTSTQSTHHITRRAEAVFSSAQPATTTCFTNG